MASKLRSTYVDDALNRATDRWGNLTPSRGEGTGIRGAAADNRELSEILENPKPAVKAPAKFDPSSSREALIGTAAYYRAERRGFLPGHEVEDWIAAEREIDDVGTDPI
jgi:Protein of unknown function (DUF2934)